MTETQRRLARHALGFPNKKNESYRNGFCAGTGHDDYLEWRKMVEEGYAKEFLGNELTGGDSLFVLTLKGGLEARDEKEHLSREEAEKMRPL